MQKIAITISPPPRTLYREMKNPFKCQYMDDKLIIEQVFKYNRIKSFIIYPEFTDKGRLHYHGIVCMNTNEFVRFYRHALHKLRRIGFVDISLIQGFTNNLRQVIYMSKNWGVSKDILEIKDPIMYEKDIPKLSMLLVNNHIRTLDYYAV